MNPKNNQPKPEHSASAKALNISISTKQGIEISDSLRYRSTAYAKKFLEEVIALRRPVPFKKFNKDMGHKRGMAAGRYPWKAAKEFLKLIKSVEANAHAKGLDTASLKIIKLIANKASIPLTGGRQRTRTRRSHIEIEVKEGISGKKEKKNKEEKNKSLDTNKAGKEKKEEKAKEKGEGKKEEKRLEVSKQKENKPEEKKELRSEDHDRA